MQSTRRSSGRNRLSWRILAVRSPGPRRRPQTAKGQSVQSRDSRTTRYLAFHLTNFDRLENKENKVIIGRKNRVIEIENHIYSFNTIVEY